MRASMLEGWRIWGGLRKPFRGPMVQACRGSTDPTLVRAFVASVDVTDANYLDCRGSQKSLVRWHFQKTSDYSPYVGVRCRNAVPG